jgi:hypothetical protein
VRFHFSLRYILPALFTCTQIFHLLYQISSHWWSRDTVSLLGLNNTISECLCWIPRRKIIWKS